LHVIGQFTGTLLDLALVVGIGVVFTFFSERFGFVDSHEGAYEFAEGDAADGVAGGADFAVDLEAAAQRLVVKGFGELLVLPWELRWVEAVSEKWLDVVVVVVVSVMFVAYPSSAGDMACVGRPNC